MNGVSFPRLQRINHRFKWVKVGESRETRAARTHQDKSRPASVVYKDWHKNRVTLYIACIRVDAAVEPDLTRIHPKAVPVAKKHSHCTNVVIGWSVAKSTAVAAIPIVGPVVRATTGSKQPRKKDSSITGLSNPSSRIKFHKWIT